MSRIYHPELGRITVASEPPQLFSDYRRVLLEIPSYRAGVVRRAEDWGFRLSRVFRTTSS